MSYTRDIDTMFQQLAPFSRDFPTISATATLPMAVVSATRSYRVGRVELMVDATYAADASDFYAFTLKHGTTTIATWSTQTAAQGALTGGTPVSMVLSGTDANLVIPALDVLQLTATKNGSAANITPRVVVHGLYVG